jgi:hypothetical protein
MCWWIGFGVVAIIIILIIGFVVYAARQQQAFEARILRDGREARGWIVTAPPDLYEVGNFLGGAAHVVFSFDSGVSASDATLREWAARVKKYLAPPDASDDEKWLEECVRTAFATSRLVPLPPEVSGDAEGYFTSVVIKRIKLPEGKITRPYILLRVVTGKDGGTVMADYPDVSAGK